MRRKIIQLLDQNGALQLEYDTKRYETARAEFQALVLEEEKQLLLRSLNRHIVLNKELQTQLQLIQMTYKKQADQCITQKLLIENQNTYIEALEHENERTVFEIRRAQAQNPSIADIKVNASDEIKKMIERTAVHVAKMLAESKLQALQANSLTLGTCTEMQDINVELVEKRKMVKKVKIPTLETSVQTETKQTTS